MPRWLLRLPSVDPAICPIFPFLVLVFSVSSTLVPLALLCLVSSVLVLVPVVVMTPLVVVT